MTYNNNYSLSLNFFASHKLNSFYVIKSLLIILVIYGDFVKNKKTFSAAASKNSLFVTPHVADDNDNVMAINNFNGNYVNRNQIIFDTFKLGIHDVDDNDLLSLSIENCSNSTNCDKKLCDTNVTTLTAKKNNNNRTNIVKAKLARDMVNTGIMTNTISKTTKNLSSLSLLSQAKSTSSPSPSPSPLLLQQQRLLFRPKRYLSFPEGSSFSVAICFTVGIIGNPRYNYMSFGLNWGVAYDLPNTTWILNHLHGFAKRPIPVAIWHRRSRRSLYKEIENVVDNMGYNGRDCILRALCESRQYFQKTKMSMIGEMLRVIFSLPKQRIFRRELEENSDIELYDRAYRKVRSIVDCSEQYDCAFSLLELAFGKYSTPPDGYYTKH